MPSSRRACFHPRERSTPLAAFVAWALINTVLIAPAARPQSLPKEAKEKLQKPRQLDKDVTFTRDSATSELKPSAAAEIDSVPPDVVNGRRVLRGPIVRLTWVTVRASAADGSPLRGLAAKDFRVSDDGVEKEVSFFVLADAVPAGVALVIDASPSVLPDSKQMTDAARALMDILSRQDEVAVVDFSAHTYLQSGFSSDRELLSRAIARVDVRSLLGDVGGSNIYEAVYLTAHSVFGKGNHHPRKAIVLFTDGQDSGLGLTLDPASTRAAGAAGRLTYEDVIRALTSADIQVFAISTENRPKVMTPHWLEAHRTTTFVTTDARRSGIPPYTLYLAELARSSGGQIYFLHEASSLADTFQQIGLRINAEYLLGFDPQSTSGVAPHQGWHALRVAVPGHPGANVVYRPDYYVPAEAN
jgi:VWFA-related protein